MATSYIRYPKASGSGVTGSVTGVPYSVGPLNGADPSLNGAVIGSFTLYLQSATATFPGLVSSSVQQFSGLKVFLTPPNINPLLASLPLALDSSKGMISRSLLFGSPDVIGSVSLSNQVSGLLPANQVLGSLTGSPYIIGTFNGAALSFQGAVIGSNSLFLQGATATQPGLVSSSSQTFSGTKTFNNPIALVTNGTVSYADGLFFYDNVSLTPTFYNNIASVSLQIGQENWVYVRNTSGATIQNGRAVYFNGSVANGDTPTIALAQANTSSTSQLAGIATHDIANNSFGFVTQYGKVHGLDTSAYSGGQRVWLSSSSAGFFQVTEPIAPNFNVFVGYVLDVGSTTGSLFLPSIRFGALNPTNTFRTLVLGSITMSQANGGATYQLQWPLVQGGASTVLSNNGSGSLSWASALTNPMSASGDLIVGGSGGAVTRFGPVGQDNMVLKGASVSSTSIKWDYPDGNLRTFSGASSVLTSDGTLICSSGTSSVTLLTAVGKQGQKLKIYNNTNSFNPISVIGSVTTSFGVVSSTTLNTQGETLDLYSDNTNWLPVRTIPTSINNYTPTGSWTTNATYTGRWARKGQELHCTTKVFLTGSADSGILQVSIPSGLQIATNQIISSTSIFSSLGILNGRDDSAGSAWPGYIGYQGSTTVKCFYIQATAPTDGDVLEQVLSNAPVVFAVNDFVCLDFTVPIAGWNG